MILLCSRRPLAFGKLARAVRLGLERVDLCGRKAALPVNVRSLRELKSAFWGFFTDWIACRVFPATLLYGSLIHCADQGERIDQVVAFYS